MIVFSSCEEDPSKIGGGILPGSDFNSVVGLDTFSLEMYTMFIDTVRSQDPQYSFLGTNLDPYFGLTTSDFATQLWLYTPWPKGGYILDSVTITMQIEGIIGEMTIPHEIKMYEVDEYMDFDSVYYVNRNVPVLNELASLSIEGIDSDTIITQNLPIEFAEYLLRDTTMLYLSSDSLDFRDYFNGIYFSYPQSTDYHMLQLSLIGGTNFITIYYHNALDIAQTFTFPINNKCARYNRFLHDYDAADAGKKISYINQPVLDTLAYTQGMEGVFTKLIIPGLEQLKDQMPIAINKARLIFPVFIDIESFSEERIAQQIFARYNGTDGLKYSIPEYRLNPGFADGTFNIINNKIELNLSIFVQQYLEGEILLPEIELFVNQNDVSNLIFKANSNQDPPLFEVSYTIMD